MGQALYMRRMDRVTIRWSRVKRLRAEFGEKETRESEVTLRCISSKKRREDWGEMPDF